MDLFHYLAFCPGDLLFIGHHLATLFVFVTCRYLVSHGACAILALLVLAELTNACQNAWTLARARRDDVVLAAKLYVKQIDASQSGECRGRHIRVCVNIDIRQPISRGQFMDIGDSEPLWNSPQYERMPIFCYWCGLINHDEKDCKTWTDSGSALTRDDEQYSPWLRASTTNIQQPQVVNTKTT
ncbi:hypothetical protein SO802_031840 [Lithocarpus litseifolius]|uniref:Zinc knuckle CX2CX4HX4C domain-containing protein n=1 Tax=Lithocarpus litseifolius TaxID=425828 RepID=A0AAW2BLL8_9ROSI